MTTSELMERTAALAHLGPAEVVDVEGTSPRVRLTGGREVPVTLALQLPYEAAVGDVLLVVGDREAFWAIGVLHAGGKLSLSLLGDVRLHAVDGTLELSGDRGVAIRGEAVDVQAGSLSMVARSVMQTFGKATQRVRELLSVCAGRSHTAVAGDATTTAQNATTIASEHVNLNAKQINIG